MVEGTSRQGVGLSISLYLMLILQSTCNLTFDLNLLNSSSSLEVLEVPEIVEIIKQQHSSEVGRKQTDFRTKSIEIFFLPGNFNSVNSEAVCTKQVVLVELESPRDDTEMDEGKNSSPRLTGVSRVSVSAFFCDWRLSSSALSTLLIVLRTV